MLYFGVMKCPSVTTNCKECLISNQLGYEGKLHIGTHISLYVSVIICIIEQKKSHLLHFCTQLVQRFFRYHPSITKSLFTFGIVLNLPSDIFSSEK